MLAYDSFGPDGPDRLLICHGLFGSARNWRAIARHAARQMQVITVDMRNHGRSFWSGDMSYPAMADDLAEVIEATGGPALVLGHSMGGKAAMALALRRPELVRGLMIGDIAPIAYEHAQENRDLIAAMQACDLTGVTRRSEAETDLATRLSNPALVAFFLQSLEVEPTGGGRWIFNLDVLDREMETITGWPRITGSYSGPTLFLSGENSSYTPDMARSAIRQWFPDARQAALKDAGHWLHAEQPRAFMQTLDAFCAAVLKRPEQTGQP